jgi:hypothetical protein
MKIVQSRECPLCREYGKLKGYKFCSDEIEQVRTFREGHEPTKWRHPTRLGKFLHSQAEKHPALTETVV